MPRTMYAANAKMYTVASPRPAVSVPFLDPNAAYSHINKMIASIITAIQPALYRVMVGYRIE